MRVTLENTNVDPRIFDVTIDFTSYPKDSKYFPLIGRYYVRRCQTVPIKMLNQLLTDLKLRPLNYWRYVNASQRGRVNVYQTTVISDRMNKRNDVG